MSSRPQTIVVPAAAMQLVAAAAAGAHHVLGEALLRAMALEVVVVAAQHDARVTCQPVPERIEVGRPGVRACAVARPVPERDAAVARACQGVLEPVDLGGVGPVRCL